LAATFGLAALLAAGGRDSSGVRRAGKLASSAFLYAMALACKENAASFPAVAFLLGVSSKDASDRRRWWATMYVWGMVLMFYLGWRKWGLEFPTLPDNSDRPLLANFIMQLSVIAHYLRILFWPWSISVIYGMKLKVGFLEEPAPGMLTPLAALVLLLCIVAAAISKVRKSPEIFVGMGWFLFTILPESIMPLNQAANDRRLYFPMIGIVIAAVGAGARAIRGRQKAWWALPIVAAGLFALLSVHRVNQWRSSIALWTDSVKKSPSTSVTWINLGHTYVDLGMIDKGLDIFHIGYAVNPNSDSLINNIGVVFVKKGQMEEAIELFTALAQKYPRYPDGWYNLGTVLYQLGKYHDAENAFRSLLEISPGYAEGHLNLGNCLYELGNVEGAKHEFEEALKFDPELLEAKRNLQMVKERLSGKKEPQKK
jgi:tetratricopeptide (TPR) repeat protein